MFAHDLLADWARLRILMGHSDNLVDFLQDRLDSPLWHRAVRLYGMHLLEHVGDLEQWRALLVALSGEDGGGQGDLLLESIIFAADPLPLLTKVRSDLVRNDGRLLRRMLGRFLAFATLPDPHYLALARSEGHEMVSVAARYRYPNWPYWPALLRFLYEYRAEVVPAAPIEMARVTEIWLHYAPEGTPFRREAAELGLMLGERARKARKDHGAIDHEHCKSYYRAALAGAGELPDAVAELALRASERNSEDQQTQEAPAMPKIERKSIRFNLRYDADEPRPEPWPDGPRAMVDRDFQEVVLEPGVLTSLIRTRPAIAREVILASLIKARRQFEWSDSWHESTELDLAAGRLWHPPFYTHGPFLEFLKFNFGEGLETIARLVDFASERWRFYAELEARKHEAETKAGSSDISSLGRMLGEWRQPPGTVILPLPQGDRELIGDTRVYGWSAALGNPPSAVVAALMALEQFFYLEIDEGRPVEDKARTVLERGRSAAFLKVLCDIGKRQVTLFEGALRPLLAAPEVFWWDIEANAHGRQHLMIGGMLQGEWFVRLAQSFHGMEHRSIDLREIAVHLFLNNEGMREYLANVRQRCEQRLKNAPDGPLREFMQQLVIGFEIENYKQVEHPEYGRVFVNVRAYELQGERAEANKAFDAQSFLAILPVRCRRMLDESIVLDGDELEGFWNDINQSAQRGGELSTGHDAPEAQVASPARSPEQTNGAENLVNALTGAAAVFIRLHGDWLAKHPERKQWCIDQLQATILNPPARDPMDVPESTADWTWDCFAAEALPILWAEEPNNVTLRHLIARLVLAHHYEAVKILFQRCAERRLVFGDDFDRLRRLLFEFAYVRNRISFVEHARHYKDTLTEDEVQQFGQTIEAWAAERITSFVEGELPLPSETWHDMDQPERFGTIDERHRQRFGSRILDFQLVHAGHEWLPTIDQASNEQERRDWLEFWRAALTFALGRVADGDDKSIPNKDDHWVIDGVAAALTLMMPEERPEDLWHPILDLPSDAHYWSEDFLRSFYRVGLQQDHVSPRFASLRTAMVEYALGEAARHDDTRWSYREEVWQALFGIDAYTRDYWKPSHRELAEQSLPILERWMAQEQVYSRHLAAFAAWLEKEAADPVRLLGLIWLDRALIGDDTKRISNRTSAEEPVASLLHVVWQKDEARLRRNSDAFAAFQRLLRWLTDRQNALALELVRMVGHL